MRSRLAGQWPAGVSAAVLRQSCFSRKPQSPLVRSLTAALRPGAAPGVTARGGRWPVPGCCHGNTEISAGFSNWGCSQAKLTHATNRHTVCDIHQCRSSKATESRFQWRPDHLWGARCGQEARGGATPGLAVLGFVQKPVSGGIHGHTSSVIPPNTNVKSQGETEKRCRWGARAGTALHTGP